MFGEQIQHVHFVLMPRGSEVPVEHRSAALILNQAHYIDPEAALQAAVRLREALQAQDLPVIPPHRPAACVHGCTSVTCASQNVCLTMARVT